jgi:transcriptional regulator with XRE-family HTH domain
MALTKKPNPIDIHVGGRVRMRRMILGMSQERLGEQLGITFQQIQKYEKGTNRIGASRLQNIAGVLSVPVSYFFENAPTHTGAPGLGDGGNGHVADFQPTSETIQLNRAFVRIGDPRVRRRILDLVRSLAGDGEDGETRASGQRERRTPAD